MPNLVPLRAAARALPAIVAAADDGTRERFLEFYALPSATRIPGAPTAPPSMIFSTGARAPA